MPNSPTPRAVEGRELGILIVECVMGHKVYDLGQVPVNCKDEPIYAMRYKGNELAIFRWMIGPGSDWWEPHIDPRAAFEMEERFEELHGIAAYARALFALVAEDIADNEEARIYWALAHATPAQRCQAALLALQTPGREEGA